MFWRYMWLALVMVAFGMIGWILYTITHPAQVPCSPNAIGCGLADRPD